MMETLENMDFDDLNLPDEEETFADLVPYIKENVLGAARWQMFYAIVGGLVFSALATFCFMGVIVGISTPAVLFMGIFSLILMLIGCYLYWQLYQTTNAIEKFTIDEDPDSFEQLLTSYKSYWKCYGIILITIVVIIVLAVLAAIATT